MLAIDVHRLLGRAGPLTFGVIGTSGVEVDRTIGAGSGVFIAPMLGLTAKHVSLGLYELEPGVEPRYSETPKQTSHIVNLFQALDPFDQQSPYAFWHVDRDWNFVYSDLCLMEVSPDDGSADQMAAKWPRRPFALHLLPPPVGAIVQAFGYPKHAAHSRGSKVHIDAPATFVEGTVIDVHSPYRDRGFMSFPCFAVEMAHKIDHGFSGGPVFYDGQLAGIISAASDFDSIAYVATLWPLLRNDKVVHLLRTWQMAAHGWENLRARVTLCDDDRGSFLDLAGPEKTA